MLNSTEVHQHVTKEINKYTYSLNFIKDDNDIQVT